MSKYIANYVGFSSDLESNRGNKGIWNLTDFFFFRRKGEWQGLSGSFSISPSYSGKSVWDFDADGSINITSGDYTITSLTPYNINVKIWGGGGGQVSGAGGGGGYSQGQLSGGVGDVYLLKSNFGAGPVGSGAPAAGNGAGAYGIFTSSFTHPNSLIIAGGGGGGSNDTADGGGGGGTTGGDSSNFPTRGGGGGTQIAGGAGAQGGSPGSALQGGAGAQNPSGAGGGGGYYGGGGGGSPGPGGGGGGSGYVAPTVNSPYTVAGQDGFAGAAAGNFTDPDCDGVGRGDGGSASATPGRIVVSPIANTLPF